VFQEGSSCGSEEEGENGSGGLNDSVPDDVTSDGRSLQEDVAGLNAAGTDPHVPQQFAEDIFKSLGSSLPEDTSDSGESGGDDISVGSNLSRRLSCHSASDTGDEDVLGAVHIDSDLGERSELLYDGGKKTKDEAVLEVLDLYLKNKWTKKSLEGVIKCMASTLPEGNQFPPTLHRLCQYLKAHSPVIEEVAHFYCTSCLSGKDSRSAICLQCQSPKGGVFFEIPMKAQIQFFF